MWWWLLSVAWAAEPGAPFVRVAEEGSALSLELASRDYVADDGTRVTLVGVAHIAEPSFYEAVAERLAPASVVLFEGVSGGEEPSEGEEEGLTAAYVALADALQLAFQKDALDYDQDHWRNSDLSIERIQERIGASGGDPDEVVRLLSGGRELGKLEKLARKAGRNDTVRVMVELSLVETLPRAEEALSVALGPDTYDWIVVARNEQVHADLTAARGPDAHVAVLYGAAHLRDLEERLLSDGFTVDGETWHEAIEVDPEAAGVPAAMVSMVRKKIAKKLDKMVAKARR